MTVLLLFHPTEMSTQSDSGDSFRFTAQVMRVSHQRSAFMYLLYLFFFSLSMELLYCQSADALLWHLCEWGPRGWGRRWCFNDGTCDSCHVCCGFLREGFKTAKKKKYLHHHDKCPFPWLNLGLYDFPKVTENTWSHHIRPFMPSLQKAHCDIFP